MEWNLKHNISKLVDATKVRLKRKFIALNVYVKQNKTKQNRSQSMISAFTLRNQKWKSRGNPNQVNERN